MGQATPATALNFLKSTYALCHDFLPYTHIRILEEGFLNVPHKDFGCSNDHFVNEF